jgi:hypothetical protein
MSVDNGKKGKQKILLFFKRNFIEPGHQKWPKKA